jgi:hypothetical protein
MFKGLAELGIWPFTWIYYRKVTLPKPEELVPEFAPADTLISEEYYYNPDFYVTEATAKKIRDRFNALVAFQKIVHDSERSAPQQWFVRFSDGLEVNAGQLAKFFAQYPEKDYPGIAPRFGLSLISHERGMKKMLAQQERGE